MIAPTMNAHEFIDYGLQVEPNNPYIHFKDNITCMLDDINDVADNEPIEKLLLGTSNC